jgi:ATP-dependent protease ClpP protease subunit
VERGTSFRYSNSSKRNSDLKQQLTQIYVDHTSTSKKYEEYEKAMDRDNYLSPGDAKEMG